MSGVKAGILVAKFQVQRYINLLIRNGYQDIEVTKRDNDRSEIHVAVASMTERSDVFRLCRELRTKQEARK